MGIINKVKIFFKNRGKHEVVTELDPELLKQNQVIMHLTKALAYERGLNKKMAKNLEDLSKPTSNEKIAEYLTQQKKELIDQDLGIATGLKNILRMARDKKKSIHILSKGRERDFGILKDIGIMNNGLIAIYVFGVERPIISARTINEIFAEPSGLRHDANRWFLEINLDKNGNPVEIIESIETPNVIIDANNKIHVMNNDLKPFIERLTEKNMLIDEQLAELRSKEKEISEITKDFKILEKDNEVLKAETSSYKSSLSDVMNDFKEIQIKYHNMTKSLSLLEDENALFEETKDKQDEVIRELHERLAEKEEQPVVDRAMDRIKKLWRHYEEIRPRIESNEPEQEEKPMPRPVKP